jgi:hypothetical protein
LGETDFVEQARAAHTPKAACAESGARRMRASCERLALLARHRLLHDTREIVENFDGEAAHFRALEAESTSLPEWPFTTPGIHSAQ